jgi:hypothetical protein
MNLNKKVLAAEILVLIFSFLFFLFILLGNMRSEPIQPDAVIFLNHQIEPVKYNFQYIPKEILYEFYSDCIINSFSNIYFCGLRKHCKGIVPHDFFLDSIFKLDLQEKNCSLSGVIRAIQSKKFIKV